jgi:hypothetical protein
VELSKEPLHSKEDIRLELDMVVIGEHMTT